MFNAYYVFYFYSAKDYFLHTIISVKYYWYLVKNVLKSTKIY